MSDKKNKETEIDEEDLQASIDAALEGQVEEDVDPLEDAQAEIADLKDRVLRTAAEMENLRRRTEKEVRDAKQYAVASFARDMLIVSDNLQRALEAVPEETRANADPSLANLLEGVLLTEREMQNQLNKHGVVGINPEGEKFDPNFHQAMFEVPNPEVPNSTVVQVVQSGYKIGERVLRPAMVGVAKGGPKEVKPAGDAPSADGDSVAQDNGQEKTPGVDKTA